GGDRRRGGLRGAVPGMRLPEARPAPGGRVPGRRGRDGGAGPGALLPVGKGLPRRPGRGLMPARFDPVIHPPPRLQICARLAAVETMDFATLREMLDVSESVLSKHVKTLEDAGYVAI